MGFYQLRTEDYVEYLPYIIFHSISNMSVYITTLVVSLPLIFIGIYLQQYTKRKWAISSSLRINLPAARAYYNQNISTSGEEKVSLTKEIKDLILLRKPYGTNLTTIILALDLLLVFIVGAGYTFNYLVITSSDGGRFFEYLLMLGNVKLFLNTPWFNDSLPIVDPSTLMVIMLCIGSFLSHHI